MTGFEAVVLTIVTAATPLLIAALGELVTERSGVLNLGVEGMMIVGAVTGFAGAQLTGSPYLGVIAAMAAGWRSPACSASWCCGLRPTRSPPASRSRCSGSASRA